MRRDSGLPRPDSLRRPRLTASLSAWDWDKNGVIEASPSITTQAQGSGYVAVLDVPDHTGGAIFRPTNKLPSQYRIEYKP